MAANTTLSLSICFTSSLLLKHKPQVAATGKRFVSCSVVNLSSLWSGGAVKSRVCTALAAVVDKEAAAVAGRENDDFSDQEEEPWVQPRPTEVYVCNLPRSCDNEQLLHMFKPHGDVLSVEVCRNAETGASRGCAYVILGSINSAKNAVAKLDGSDVGGREMRVRFSVEINRRRNNLETMNSSPKRVLYYEGPHKLYVGNLHRSVKPEEVRHLFVRYGHVASVRVLQDQRQGRTRVYAFVTFLSQRERDVAISLNGTVFAGRALVVREGVERSET